MKIGVLIIARLSSSRLPGKVLMKIKNSEILSHIILSVSQIVDKENIVVATSTDKTDDKLVEWCADQNIHYYRGSLSNVSERFLNAAKYIECDYAIRINGDNLFVDLKTLQNVIDQSKKGIFDLITNVHKRTYPKGMSFESVKVSFYESQMPFIQQESCHREHVTSYLYEKLDEIEACCIYNEELPEIGGIQLAIDTPEDFERSEAIINKLDRPHWTYNFKEIFEIWKTI